MRLDDLPGHSVHELDLELSGLLQPCAGGLLRGGVAQAKVAELPVDGGVEIESPAKIAHHGVWPTAIAALAHVQQQAGQQRGVLLAVQSPGGFFHQVRLWANSGRHDKPWATSWATVALGETNSIGTIVGSCGTRTRVGSKCSNSTRRAEATLTCAAACDHGVFPHGKLRLRPIGVGLIALTGAGEGRRQLGEPLRVVERLLRNGLLLECPQQIEVGHGREQEKVVRGGCGRVLPGRHLLVRDARLENRVRDGELGRYAGDRRSTAAHRIHSQAGFQRRAAGHRDRAIAVLQRPVMVLVIDPGLNGRQP